MVVAPGRWRPGGPRRVALVGGGGRAGGGRRWCAVARGHRRPGGGTARGDPRLIDGGDACAGNQRSGRYVSQKMRLIFPYAEMWVIRESSQRLSLLGFKGSSQLGW